MSAFIKSLWPDIKKGDQAAWVELVHRYSGLILAIAKRVGLSSVDAEDCAQHTWTALFRGRHSIKDPERLPAWLIMTTKRHAIRMLEKRRRYDLPFDFENTGNVIPPDEELLNMELRDTIEHAIQQLEPKCQKILTALFLSPEKQSYKDIARKLNLSINTMGSLRLRCLKKLSEILKKMGYPEHQN